MPMSDYVQDGLRTLIFRSGAGLTKPTHLYVALHTANPNDDGGGAEVVGGSYGRVQRDPGDANWGAGTPTDGITTNIADIVFPPPTANWGLVTHVAVWDAVSGGNLICYAILDIAKNVNQGDSAPRFVAASLIWIFV